MRCLEIELVTLFSALSLWAMLKLAERPTVGYGIALAVFFGAAVFSKGPGLFHAGLILGLTAWAILNKATLTSRLRGMWEKSPRAVSLVAASIGLATLALAMKFADIVGRKLEVQGLAYHWEHALTQGRMFWG